MRHTGLQGVAHGAAALCIGGCSLMHWRLQSYALEAAALCAEGYSPTCCILQSYVLQVWRDGGGDRRWPQPGGLHDEHRQPCRPAALPPQCSPSEASVQYQCSLGAAPVQRQCSPAALQPCSPAALHWCSPAVLIAASVQPPVVLVPTNVSRPHSYPGCTAAAPRAYAGTPWPAKNDGRVVVRALLRGGLRPASDDTRVLSYATQRGRKCESSARVVRE